MQKTYAAIILVVVLTIIGVGAFLLTGSDDATETNFQNPAGATPTAPSATNDSQELASYTLEEVAQRNGTEECWTIVNGQVYDITSYLPRHPGGDEILLACGVDGTSLFTERKTDDGETVGSGTPHSGSATRQLERFKIGTLR